MITYSGPMSRASMKIMLDEFLSRLYPASPNDAWISLYQNNITPSEASVFADFTKADFTGYADINLQDEPAPTTRFDANGNAYAIDGTVRGFTQSGATVTNVVYGFYLWTAGTFFGAYRFSAPIEFDHSGKHLDLELGYRINTGGVSTGADVEESA